MKDVKIETLQEKHAKELQSEKIKKRLADIKAHRQAMDKLSILERISTPTKAATVSIQELARIAEAIEITGNLELAAKILSEAQILSRSINQIDTVVCEVLTGERRKSE